MTEDGLPLPPRPVGRISTIRPGANDLDAGVVRDQFNQIVTDSNLATQRWADKVQQAAQAGASMKGPRFDRGAPSLLTPPEAEIYKSMGVDSSKTGMGDMLGSVASGMSYIFSHPWTAYKDPKMVERIKAAQAQFLIANAGTLKLMDEEMSDVTASL